MNNSVPVPYSQVVVSSGCEDLTVADIRDAFQLFGTVTKITRVQHHREDQNHGTPSHCDTRLLSCLSAIPMFLYRLIYGIGFNDPLTHIYGDIEPR